MIRGFARRHFRSDGMLLSASPVLPRWNLWIAVVAVTAESKKKRTEFSRYKRSQLPSGKRLRNYGKSPCYCSCVNPLFRLGHVIFVSSQFKNTSWILPILSTQKSRKLPPKINQHRSSHLTFTGSISCKETNQGKGMVAVMSLKTCHFLRSMGWSNLTRYPGKI